MAEIEYNSQWERGGGASLVVIKITKMHPPCQPATATLNSKTECRGRVVMFRGPKTFSAAQEKLCVSLEPKLTKTY